MRTSSRVQEELRRSARRAGRAHFNWLDMKLLAGTPDVQVFAAQPEFADKPVAGKPVDTPAASATPVTVSRLVLAGVACFLTGWLAARRT
mmetsp:Transcript_6745/g.16827  ORF Transcript_6745/g.16827 Transcript_6745/m.16827 type:complete len:90 (-) Transcript_6745:92-361(-)